jgi:hypothetical protein
VTQLLSKDDAAAVLEAFFSKQKKGARNVVSLILSLFCHLWKTFAQKK